MKRRALITGLLASPFVIRTPGLLMRIKPLVLLREPLIIKVGEVNSHLTLKMLTEEAVKQFRNANVFIEYMSRQNEEELTTIAPAVRILLKGE